MQKLDKAELLMMQKVLIFYMHHHISPTNLQYKELNQIVDKIRGMLQD